MVFNPPPTAMSAAMIAMAIKAAIKPYSMAVTPSSSFKKRSSLSIEALLPYTELIDGSATGKQHEILQYLCQHGTRLLLDCKLLIFQRYHNHTPATPTHTFSSRNGCSMDGIP
jgi:hypothetical protein